MFVIKKWNLIWPKRVRGWAATESQVSQVAAQRRQQSAGEREKRWQEKMGKGKRENIVDNNSVIGVLGGKGVTPDDLITTYWEICQVYLWVNIIWWFMPSLLILAEFILLDISWLLLLLVFLSSASCRKSSTKSSSLGILFLSVYLCQDTCHTKLMPNATIKRASIESLQ